MSKKAPGLLLAGVAAALLGSPAAVRAADSAAELRALIEQQNKQIQEQSRQIEEMKKRLDALKAPAGAGAIAPAAKDDKAKPDPDAVKKITADYLKDNPGAGMPPSVQTGFFSGQGFVIRSTNDPAYAKWDDESRIPFELRFRGRVQLDYYGYKVTDDQNHATEQHQVAQNANSHRFADFSQLEVKRLRLIWEGTVFDPNLRYHFELDGNTRGLGGVQNNKVIDSVGGTFDPNGSAASPIGGGVTVDHAVRLFSAYVAYDFHGCASEKGCGPDCPDGTFKYAPTYTLIVGKIKPTMSAEEWMSGSGNEQFVEFSMADWYFDVDDDNLLMAAGAQVRAFDDRFFLQAIITNGNESQFPNTQMDELPGFVVGTWYDFGGTWNRERKKWDLFGNSFSDIDYSCKPVIRVAGAAAIIPMDRRSLYGDDEQSRVFVMPAGPGGTRLINLLDGGTFGSGTHAVDKFDYYTYEAFVGAKWRGFSLTNDFWIRDLQNFKATPKGFDQIIYTYADPRAPHGTINALFPNKPLLDFGYQLQAGYFIVKKKLEVVARWSWISGDSGDVLGDTRLPPTVIDVPNGTAGKAAAGLTRVQINPGAFTHYHGVNEYTVGINYFFRGELLKWQTDFSVYQGGNPAGGGSSPAGFIPGEDGYLLRTQIQLAF
ncbi:MAG TPA: hypothetical protein VJ739_11860 [Gemmataceae bacterium]|nr:hypothetical protein [Gemmataceae bacterium]